jgi:hypothetical protein
MISILYEDAQELLVNCLKYGKKDVKSKPCAESPIMNGENCSPLWIPLGKCLSDTNISNVCLRHANKHCLLDEPDLLPRLRAGVRPPMTMEEHVDHLESLYAQIVDRTPASW